MTVTETDTGDRGNAKATELPVEQLKDAVRELGQALMVRTLEKASGQVEGLTQRLNDAADDGGGTGSKMAAAGVGKIAQGGSPLKAGVAAGVTGAKEKVKKAVGAGGDGGKGRGGGGAKVINIIEEFDVGLPRRVAYDQWTQFADFPSFTKKVESVEQESDEKINWRAQIFLSHRSWESTIIEQVPDERIVWKSKGAKGYVDGAVTFHELAPTMTRVLIVAEYHPDGFFEKTANLWRAQGRRLRLDFKNIKRHMMTQTLLNQDDTEGWRGEIRDGEVVKTHEEALQQEQEGQQDQDGQEQADKAPDQGGQEQDQEGQEQADQQEEGQDQADGAGEKVESSSA
ncbi:SRPBCC family protein [Actinomadura latina]|uniref:SRPBCC family protein n=1 Tax=Actinomadura latina TaxID=163603 RepID=UPI000A47E0F5|nr:SRPBCC family protein [Actinomadura latina]